MGIREKKAQFPVSGIQVQSRQSVTLSQRLAQDSDVAVSIGCPTKLSTLSALSVTDRHP